MKQYTFLTLPTALMLSSSGLQAQAADINPSLSIAASKVDLAGSHIELNRVDGDIELITSYLEKFIEVAQETGEPVP
ncbi:MAG: hypothetical protein ABGY95_09585 [Rubritalea sp.]|uniref:hypothetical protein n=1 Tax=Rubritalea sp. TaxID=2109375 RepID=UPI003242405B